MRLRPCLAAVVCAVLIGGCGGSFRLRTAPPTAPRTPRTKAAPRAVTTTSVAPIIYQVRSGDTLSAVARQYRVSVASIVAKSHLASADQLQEGQSLRIPRAAPLKATVDPSVAFAGQTFRFMLTGAVPGDTVRFDVDSPVGLFSGDSHVVPARGVVIGTFHTSQQDRAGIYYVTAIGTSGTRATTYFGLAPAPADNP